MRRSHPHVDVVGFHLPAHFFDDVLRGTRQPHREELLATLTAWCAGQGVLAESVLVERQTLEDRFLELTGKALR